MVSRKRRVTTGACSPVAYDKSITIQEGKYVLTVREDVETLAMSFDTLEQAQEASDFLAPDYGEMGEARAAWEIYKLVRSVGMTERGLLDAVA